MNFISYLPVWIRTCKPISTLHFFLTKFLWYMYDNIAKIQIIILIAYVIEPNRYTKSNPEYKWTSYSVRLDLSWLMTNTCFFLHVLSTPCDLTQFNTRTFSEQISVYVEKELIPHLYQILHVSNESFSFYPRCWPSSFSSVHSSPWCTTWASCSSWSATSPALWRLLWEPPPPSRSTPPGISSLVRYDVIMS